MSFVMKAFLTKNNNVSQLKKKSNLVKNNECLRRIARPAWACSRGSRVLKYPSSRTARDTHPPPHNISYSRTGSWCHLRLKLSVSCPWALCHSLDALRPIQDRPFPMLRSQARDVGETYRETLLVLPHFWFLCGRRSPSSQPSGNHPPPPGPLPPAPAEEKYSELLKLNIHYVEYAVS